MILRLKSFAGGIPAMGGLILVTFLTALTGFSAEPERSAERRYLYVATPGIRNYLEFGGHGLLVFEMDRNHQFVRRIATGGLDSKGQPLNVKGICAHAKNRKIYLSTLQSLLCIDLVTDQLLWEKKYPGGCDRMSITPDGSKIYLPSLESAHWHVVDANNGEVLAKIVPDSGAHNTICGLDGRHAYLAGLKSPLLSVVETDRHAVDHTVGPFSASIRPFTVNGAQTLCFVNINELLGFEVGDLTTGKMLHRVEVEGFKKGPTKRHGCPSHGVGLTPNEKELWVCDAANSRIHIYNATTMPPKLLTSIALREQPGWVTFSLDGVWGYPSTGEVIEVASHKIVAALADEKGREVHSEKMLEIDFAGQVPVRNGDQFGLGRAGIAK